MIRFLLLLGFIFYSFPSLAKTVYANGKYRHNEEISTKDGCDNALQRAKLDATQKGVGMTISSEELEKCSQIDGESNCERNQFFLATFNADFTDIEVLDTTKKTETLSDGDISYICEIKIRADVEPIKQINDPSFNFNVELNSHNFKSGNKITMEIGFNAHMYFTIFQYLPYERQGNQVYKIFPNKKEENNFIKSKKITLPSKGITYEVNFPEEINKKNIDEYLFFLGSDKDVKWLDEYNNINELKSSYINSNNKVKTKFKQYTIYK